MAIKINQKSTKKCVCFSKKKNQNRFQRVYRNVIGKPTKQDV